MNNLSKIRVIVILFLAGIVIGVNCLSAFAVSADYATSYKSDEEIYPGTLVSLSSKDKTKIIPTTKANSANYIGVFVKKYDSTVTVNAKTNEGQVATSGNVIALVSDETGKIKKGDLLGVSSITGVAAKADSSPRVVGVAMQNFDLTSAKNSSVNINIPGNVKRNFTVGPIEMQIFVVKESSESARPAIVGWIEQMSGKPVSMLKFSIIVVLILALMISVSVMAYSATKNTIVQSGRNPLAKPVIFSTLLRVVIIISAISFVGSVLIYAIIKA